MPTKQEIIDSLEDRAYTKKEVSHLVYSVANARTRAPEKLKRGDIFADQCGQKYRPVVIVRVLDHVVFGIPLSSTEGVHCLCDSSSRFAGTGYFSMTLVCSPVDRAKENFLGVYDNDILLNKAVKALRSTIDEIL